MNRFTTFAVAVLGLSAAATSQAAAQASGNANILVKAKVLSSLTVTNQQDLDFGNVFQGTPKTIAAASTSAGRWAVAADVNGKVDITFTLPASSQLPHKTLAATNLPVSSWSACFADNASATSCSALNTGAPNAGINVPAATFYVFLGGAVNPATNQASGDYEASATLTVAYVY